MNAARWFVVTVTAEISWPSIDPGHVLDAVITDLMSRDDIVTVRVGRPTVFRLDVASTSPRVAEQWGRDVMAELTTRLGLQCDAVGTQSVAEAMRSVGPISAAN